VQKIHKLTVAYDGTPFSGWQIQGNKPTVQLHLEQVVERCWGQHHHVYGSGRTDSGVHATGQVAHFDAEVKFANLSALQSALNHNLPPEIRIVRAVYARPDFHARFSARGKKYVYRIANTPFHDPFELHRSWHVPRPLNLALMEEALAHLIGLKDFASFTSNPGYERATTVRHIRKITLRRRQGIVELSFWGDGFLYRMVRNLVGALVKVGLGRLSPESFHQVLESRRRSAAPNTAPACGLYLQEVFYRENYV